MPADQEYEIRVLTSQATGFNAATVGNTGVPPYDGTSAPCDADSVAVDAANNLYMLSSGEENSFTLRKMNASGAQAWGVQVGQCSMVGGRGLASDGTSVYVDAARENGAIHGLYKYDAASGAPASFGGSKANFVDYRESAVGALAFTMDCGPIAGLANDPGRIWCLLGNSTIEVHRKDTGVGHVRAGARRSFGPRALLSKTSLRAPAPTRSRPACCGSPRAAPAAASRCTHGPSTPAAPLRSRRPP